MTGFAGADRNYFYGGGPPPPGEREINTQFEPGALINLAAAGVVKQDELVDAQILAGMPYGRNATEANKPTLEFPFMSMRMLNSGFGVKSEQYQEQLNKLLSLLPEELRARLSEEMAAHPGERDPVFASLNKTLAFAAMALGWAGIMAQANDGNKTTLHVAKENLFLPEKALQNLLAEGEQTLKGLLPYLKKIGPNDPHYDDMVKLMKEAARAFKMLKRLSDEQKRHKGDKEESKKDKNKKSMQEALLEVIERASAHTRHSRKGNELMILDSALNAMTLVSKAQTLNDGLRSLLLSSAIINTGIDTEKSAAGLLGPATKHFFDAWANVLGSAYMKESGSGAHVLFSSLLTTGFAAAIAAAIYTLESDVHKHIMVDLIGEEDLIPSEKDQLLTNVYTLWNIIAIALKVDILNLFIPENLKESPYGFSINIDVISQAIEALAIAMIAHIAAEREFDSMATLILGLSPHLIPRFKVLEEALNAAKNANIKALKLPPEQIDKAVLHLAHCRLALEKEEVGQYREAFKGLLSAFDIATDTFDNEIKGLYTHLKTMVGHLSVDIQDYTPPDTTVTQI